MTVGYRGSSNFPRFSLIIDIEKKSVAIGQFLLAGALLLVLTPWLCSGEKPLA